MNELNSIIKKLQDFGFHVEGGFHKNKGSEKYAVMFRGTVHTGIDGGFFDSELEAWKAAINKLEIVAG